MGGSITFPKCITTAYTGSSPGPLPRRPASATLASPNSGSGGVLGKRFSLHSQRPQGCELPHFCFGFFEQPECTTRAVSPTTKSPSFQSIRSSAAPPSTRCRSHGGCSFYAAALALYTQAISRRHRGRPKDATTGATRCGQHVPLRQGHQPGICGHLGHASGAPALLRPTEFKLGCGRHRCCHTEAMAQWTVHRTR